MESVHFYPFENVSQFGRIKLVNVVKKKFLFRQHPSTWSIRRPTRTTSLSKMDTSSQTVYYYDSCTAIVQTHSIIKLHIRIFLESFRAGFVQKGPIWHPHWERVGGDRSGQTSHVWNEISEIRRYQFGAIRTKVNWKGHAECARGKDNTWARRRLHKLLSIFMFSLRLRTETLAQRIQRTHPNFGGQRAEGTIEYASILLDDEQNGTHHRILSRVRVPEAQQFGLCENIEFVCRSVNSECFGLFHELDVARQISYEIFICIYFYRLKNM